MATQSDVVSRMVATLAITEPDLDTSVGSVTRKILDAVAQQVADSYVDGHLLAYQYDIDSKVEADLDDFVQLFGLSRIAAKRATGVVTFQRGAGTATTAVFIPVNTEIASSQAGGINGSTLVQTATPSVIPQNTTTVEVPVQAVIPGVEGNVGAGLLTRFRSPIEGVLAVTNIQPLSGGIGAETDSELRARWKRTVFRSLAGTESMYLGIALNHESCFGANVLGATKTHREQVQILHPTETDDERTKGVGVVDLDDVRFAYPDTAIVGPHLDGANVLVRGYDYELDTSVRPPRLLMLSDTYLTGEFNQDGVPLTAGTVGSVFDLTFEYAPEATRNLPGQGITNRVDVWCAGRKIAVASQAVIFQANKRFVPDFGSPYCVDNYVREDQARPKVSNIFIPLAFGPIIDLPNTLNVAGQTYKNGEDYWLVHDDTADGWAANSRFGLEWKASSAPTTVINPVFIVGENDDYLYNQMVEQIQSGIERWRLVGIDAVAHAAKLQELRFNLAIMYSRGASPDLTNSAIETSLNTFLRSLSFGATVQVSDVIQAVHNASGVDNVRLLDARDWGGYNPAEPNKYGVGIQRVVNGRVVESYVEGDDATPYDITFGEAEIPIFESIRGDRLDRTGVAPSGIPAVRAQNTFYKGVPQPSAGGGTGEPGGGTGFPPPGYPNAGSLAPTLAARQATGERGVNTTTVIWDETPSASGYVVFRNSETTPFRSVGPANGTFKSDRVVFPNEAPGTTFYVHSYVAYDEDGTIPPNALSAPSNPCRPLTADGGTGEIVLTGTREGNQVTLTWTEFGPTIQGYSIFMDSVNNPLASLGPANGTPRGLTIMVSVPSGSHTFVVKGYTQHTGSAANATYGPQSNPVTL